MVRQHRLNRQEDLRHNKRAKQAAEHIGLQVGMANMQNEAMYDTDPPELMMMSPRSRPHRSHELRYAGVFFLLQTMRRYTLRLRKPLGQASIGVLR